MGWGFYFLVLADNYLEDTTSMLLRGPLPEEDLLCVACLCGEHEKPMATSTRVGPIFPVRTRYKNIKTLFTSTFPDSTCRRIAWDEHTLPCPPKFRISPYALDGIKLHTSKCELFHPRSGLTTQQRPIRVQPSRPAHPFEQAPARRALCLLSTRGA